MKTLTRTGTLVVTSLLAAAGVLGMQGEARAHCDTLDGPVVTDARTALDAGSVDGVLKWVTAEQEAEVRAAFDRTLEVRALGSTARSLADTYFFETLVRLHRQSEGATYDGLRPAGSETEPGIEAADGALADGAADALADAIASHVRNGIQDRFAHVVELRDHAERSPEDGRRYVAAYVDYVHYVQRVHLAVTGGEEHGH